MAGSRISDAPGGVAFTRRLGHDHSWLAVMVPLILIGGLVAWRAEGGSIDRIRVLSSGAQDLAPAALLASAADELDQATTGDGAGYTFVVLQHSSINALPGGPLVDIPDPADRHNSLGQTEHLSLGAYIERGAVSPKGFWLEIRDAPAAGKPLDFDALTLHRAALVLDEATYRNDGDGWYADERLPGIGLDPRTAALLPALLRGASDARTVSADRTDPTSEERTATTSAPGTAGAAGASSEPSIPGTPGIVARLITDAKVSAVPGIMAVDAEAFTELIEPLQLAFDDQGRLVELTAVARNLRLTGYDFLVETTITFAYPVFPPDLPAPKPLLDPADVNSKVGD
ncbi:MAG: hypothetical protein ABIR11_10775 [Candidatus Limnocylindrales bacterium]